MQEFELETSIRIRQGEPVTHRIVLSAGESVATKIQQLLASTPVEGSPADKLKTRLTRVVPVGKEIAMIIGVSIREIKNV